jgi:hypothetical protein
MSAKCDSDRSTDGKRCLYECSPAGSSKGLVLNKKRPWFRKGVWGRCLSEVYLSLGRVADPTT